MAPSDDEYFTILKKFTLGGVSECGWRSRYDTACRVMCGWHFRYDTACRVTWGNQDGQPLLTSTSVLLHLHFNLPSPTSGFQARSKDQEILEEGGGAGPSLLPRRDHE